MLKTIQIPDHALEATKAAIKASAQRDYEAFRIAKANWESWHTVLQQMDITIDNFAGNVEIVKPLLNGATHHKADDGEYDTKASWGKRAKFILKDYPNGLSAKEIVNKMAEIEPKLDKQKALNSLPATLSVESRGGKFKRVNKDGEYIYSNI